MSSPVNTIRFKLDHSKSHGRELRLLVDGIDLFELLEQSTEKCPYPGQWADKNHAVFDIVSIESSARDPGRYPLIGSTALSHEPADVSLSEFEVTHDGDYIAWSTKPPGAGIYFETEKLVEFRFHRQQYVEELQKLLSNSKRAV